MPDSRLLTSDLRNLLPGPFFCAECAERLCSAVSHEPGVVASSCDLERGELEVRYDESVVRESVLGERLRVLAVEAAQTAGHAAYRLTGLD